MHFALEKIRGFCFAEKIRQKFAYAGKSGIIYTRDEEKQLPRYKDGFAVEIPFFVKKSCRLDTVLAAGFLFL